MRLEVFCVWRGPKEHSLSRSVGVCVEECGPEYMRLAMRAAQPSARVTCVLLLLLSSSTLGPTLRVFSLVDAVAIATEENVRDASVESDVLRSNNKNVAVGGDDGAATGAAPHAASNSSRLPARRPSAGSMPRRLLRVEPQSNRSEALPLSSFDLAAQTDKAHPHQQMAGAEGRGLHTQHRRALDEEHEQDNGHERVIARSADTAMQEDPASVQRTASASPDTTVVAGAGVVDPAEVE